MHFTCKTGEACGYEVAVHFYTEGNIVFILIAHDRKPCMNADQIYVLLRADYSAVRGCTQYGSAVSGIYIKFKKSVGNKNFYSLFYPCREFFPRQRNVRAF